MNDGKVGIINCTTEKYNLHLSRQAAGSIEGLTYIEKYMYTKVFIFDMGPIGELLLCSKIFSRQEAIESKIATMSPNESVEYIEVNKQLKGLRELLFPKKMIFNMDFI